MVASAHPTFTQAGQASLAVELVFRASTVTAAYATSPMKLLTPRARGPSVWAFTSSFGGGLLAGDETRLDLRLGAGARCFVGTQASTKIYRNPDARPCGHITRATVGEGALLVFAPEAVQAFAGSRYAQRQQFHLAPGSGLALVDWFDSGRAARGERWAFQRFESRNEVFVDQDCRWLDSLLLDPGDGPIGATHRTGRFDCFALVALIGAPLHSAAERLLAEIAARPIAGRAPLVCSASPLHDGALLRLAGERHEDVAREIQNQLVFLGELLGDDPWARKW